MKNKIEKRKKIVRDKEEKILVKSATIASSKAIRTSAAMGLTRKIIKNNQIISIKPDKSTQVLRTISIVKTDLSKLKKGMVLDRK